MYLVIWWKAPWYPLAGVTLGLWICTSSHCTSRAWDEAAEVLEVSWVSSVSSLSLRCRHHEAGQSSAIVTILSSSSGVWGTCNVIIIQHRSNTVHCIHVNS